MKLQPFNFTTHSEALSKRVSRRIKNQQIWMVCFLVTHEYITIYNIIKIRAEDLFLTCFRNHTFFCFKYLYSILYITRNKWNGNWTTIYLFLLLYIFISSINIIIYHFINIYDANGHYTNNVFCFYSHIQVALFCNFRITISSTCSFLSFTFHVS